MPLIRISARNNECSRRYAVYSSTLLGTPRERDTWAGWTSRVLLQSASGLMTLHPRRETTLFAGLTRSQRTFNQFSDSTPLSRARFVAARQNIVADEWPTAASRHNLSRIIYNRMMIYGIWVFRHKNIRARGDKCGTVNVERAGREIINWWEALKIILNSMRTLVRAASQPYYGFSTLGLHHRCTAISSSEFVATTKPAHYRILLPFNANY